MSVDPLIRKYPELTPYQFSSNDPIESIDLDGAERTDYRAVKISGGRVALQKLSVGPKTWTSPWPHRTVQIPYHAVVEYNGLHYGFADGGHEKALFKEGININSYAVYSAAQFQSFLRNPDEFAKSNQSLEAADAEFERETDRFNFNIQVAQLVVEGTAGASIAGHAMSLGEGESEHFFEPGILVFPSLSARTPYEMKSSDLDWRGTGKTYIDALAEAFNRTGVERSQFQVTRWGVDQNGKSIPVEYRAPGGAEVNMDLGHEKNGPDVQHVGWQTSGKKDQVKGHILLDNVPANRSSDKLDKSQY